MSSEDLTQAERDRVTNDKPILVAANALDSAVTAKWLTGNPLSGSDLTHADAPITRAYDRHQHLQTYSASASTHYVAFDLGTSVIDFDCLFIGGHNFGTLTGLTVSLEIGTSDAFSSVTEIFTVEPGAYNKRIFALELADTSGSDPAQRFSGEQYVRLKITKGSSFLPQIGELWLGRRRHLPYKFDRELDDLRTGSEVVKFSSRSGVQTNYILSRGRQSRSGSTIIDGAADIETVKSFWLESEQGTRPVLFCENPGTAPADTQLMSQEPELSFPLVGPTFRSLNLELREIAPYVALEVGAAAAAGGGGGGGGGSTAELIYHLDDDAAEDGDLADASGNGNTGTLKGTPWAGVDQWVDSDVAGDGFDRALRIRNQGWLYPVNYISIPDLEIGESDFTIEFWYEPTQYNANYTAIFSHGSTALGAASDMLRLVLGSASGAGQAILWQKVGSSASQVDFEVDYSDFTTQMNHIAVVREATSGGNSQWNLFWNGVKAVIDSGNSNGTPEGNLTTLDMDGDMFHIGRGTMELSQYPYAMLDGLIDEVRITKSAVYTEDFTVPVVPFT